MRPARRAARHNVCAPPFEEGPTRGARAKPISLIVWCRLDARLCNNLAPTGRPADRFAGRWAVARVRAHARPCYRRAPEIKRARQRQQCHLPLRLSPRLSASNVLDVIWNSASRGEFN